MSQGEIVRRQTWGSRQRVRLELAARSKPS
jgi:hypothetical protein